VHGTVEQVADRARGLVSRAVRPLAWGEEVPVATDPNAVAVADAQSSGWKLVDPAVKGLRARADEVGQVAGDGPLVDLGGHRRVFDDRLDLRAEEETPADIRPVERLLAYAIACEEQTFARRVPESEREHPVEEPQTSLSMARVEMQDHLGVAVRAERDALRAQ